MQKPVLNKRIFWDVDFDKINYLEKSAFVIERVFERGDVEDIRQVRRFYGDTEIRKVITGSKYLPEKRIHLAAAIFDINLEQFRCYTQTPLIKGLWPY